MRWQRERVAEICKQIRRLQRCNRNADTAGSIDALTMISVLSGKSPPPVPWEFRAQRDAFAGALAELARAADQIGRALHEAGGRPELVDSELSDALGVALDRVTTSVAVD